uniref:Uncharacterized protein n=1 Tax=Knipowitschia caucasica TaxID=637954 RepID=A0AAV2M8Y4_KNICA
MKYYTGDKGKGLRLRQDEFFHPTEVETDKITEQGSRSVPLVRTSTHPSSPFSTLTHTSLALIALAATGHPSEHLLEPAPIPFRRAKGSATCPCTL